ncbi:MAG: TonB-dependent receptor [Deltaproteobacteria bacterium]|nr:TonB-dependent receptor [Deltaproteobacteria bacterium]
MKKLFVVVSAPLILAATPAWAALTGTVKLTGTPPAASPLKMDTDPKCPKGSTSDDVVVTGGKVADVFVYVKNAPKQAYPAPTTKVTLDQNGCRYSPKVFGIMVDQKLEIVNSDPTVHNVRAEAKPAGFNFIMPTQGMKSEKTFKKPQVMVPIKCDMHPWMASWAGVMDHPFFAVTDKSGAFSIDKLPDGEYEVVAWHAKLGEKTAKVKISGGNGTVELSYAK